MSVSVTGSNGFAGTVSVQPSGMPAGVTVTPSSAQISAGSAGTSFTVTAASSAAAGNSTITFTGTSGSLSHSAQLAITLQGPSPTSALGRTKYVRTDSATAYGGSLNEGWTVYDPATKRFFISDSSANLLHVMDATSEKQIAVIPVPGVYGIDITPDNSTIYAGTQIGDVYAIDPVGMAVTHRYLAAQIGPGGYQAYAVRVLANGSLALLGGQGGIPSVDGYSSVGVWNIQTNSLQLFATGYTAPVIGTLYPVTNICQSAGAIGAFLLSGDRKRIIIASIDSDSTICSFDPVTGSSNATTGSQEFIYHIAATPDGSSIVMTSYSPSGVVVLDATTLSQKNKFSVTADTGSDANLFVSADSSTLYMSNGAQVYAYDLASGAMKGWLPVPFVEASYGGSLTGAANVPTMGAMDATGLIAGPMEEGVGFIDTTTMRTGAVGTNFTNAYLSPATGPVSGGTSVNWDGPLSTSSATVSAAYFGANAASSISKGSPGVLVTTPAGSAGAVDFYGFLSDGSVQIVPEAFSYGPTILEATPDSSTAEGGGTGIIYGYGFGPTNSNTVPSDLQVSVGGQTAKITAFTDNAYDLDSPPFLLEAVAFTIPSGTAGTSSDITVTTSSGSTTLTGGMHYLPAIQQIPLSGASLAQGIYDSHRDLFYFSDTNAIRVFSRTNQTWMPSMTLSTTGHRLWAMALSPDGSKLVVSDPPTGSIYLFDPSGASAPRSFPAISTTTAYATQPGGLVVTDSGTVYFGRAVAIFGASSLARMDLSTGTVTDFTGVGASGSNSDVNFHLALSSDNSRVYFNDEGQMLYVDTASNTVVDKPVGYGCCYGDYDLHLANNQTSLEGTSFLYDGDENGEAGLALNLREAMNIQYVDGTAFSPDGSLLFQPSTNGIDVFDGRLFTLRTRIALPVALGQNYDALVSGGPDDQLVAITGASGTGIALIDLRSLSEPDPLPYVSSTMSTLGRSVRFNNSATHTSLRIPLSQIPHRFLLPGQRALPLEPFQFLTSRGASVRSASQ